MLTTPLPMKKISLYMVDADAQQAATVLAGMAAMHPIEVSEKDSELNEYPATSFYRVYHDLESRFGKIMGYYQEPLVPPVPVSEVVSLDQLQALDEGLKNLWIRVSDVEEQLRRQHERIGAIRQLSNSLRKFSSLDLDLGRLRRRGRFLRIFVGTVPSANYDQLKRALSLTSFIAKSFYTSEGLDHLVVFGASAEDEDVQDVLDSADFRGIAVPDEFKGSPAQLQSDLDRQIGEADAVIGELEQSVDDMLAAERQTLQRAQELLYRARPYARLASVLRGRGGLVNLQGWVPARRVQQLRERLRQELRFPLHIEISDPVFDEFAEVPTLLPGSALLRPFQGLVKTFGLPGYREVDPTGAFALSYILMFGMMFGDIGHGAVIALGGLLLCKRYPAAAIIAMLAGLSSTVFGFIYGSLFGYEHVIEPLWMSPMEDPVLVLVLAVIWGAGFLLFANLLSIRNLLAQGETEAALLGGRGLAGLLFYLAACYVAYRAFASGEVGWMELTLVALPFASIVALQWRHSSGPRFERIMVVFIEGLEHVISNVSGTLSFLRVAAFSLNHIALAAAVFAIAGMLDSVGHVLTVILGNIFIIGLEGAIVAIQCLRLEYYEGFSRFFTGKGRAFEPLELET